MKARGFSVVVADVSPLSKHVVRLSLQADQVDEVAFLEGQFLSLFLSDGDSRSYSYASQNLRDGRIDLHIRLHPNGKFSNHIRSGLAKGQTLQAMGPYGACTWQDETAHSSDPVLMLATGTGIAPLKAMLEANLHTSARSVWLYWGGVSATDLYLNSHFEKLQASDPRFHYRPVLADPPSEWSGHQGYVQDAAYRDHMGKKVARVYACGSPVMVESARALLASHFGLDEDSFLHDAFEPSVTSSAVPVQTAATVRVVVRNAGLQQELDLPLGANLMTSLRAIGLGQSVCGGRQSCGTCRVQLDRERFSTLKPPSRSEARLLQATPEAGPADRLSCQLELDASWNNASLTLPSHAW